MDLNTFQHKLDPGLLLVSKPEAGDPRFLMSVSLLCLHDEDGSLALILNHPLPIFIDIRDFSISQDSESEHHFPIFRGGPVSPEQCLFLFFSENDFNIDGTHQVLPNLFLGTHAEALSALSQNMQLNESNIRFYLGYAGWSFFQLDCETSNGWWFTHPSQSNAPFFPNNDNLWLRTLEQIGPEFLQKGLDFIQADL